MPVDSSASKSALVRALNTASNKVERTEEEKAEILELLGRTAGATVVGPGVSAIVGFIETRWPNKDGTPLSLGPVPLSVVIGAPMLIGSLFPWVGAKQMSYVACALFGGASYRLGHAYGAVSRVKALAKKKGLKISGEDGHEAIGAEEWTEEERALLAA